MREREAPIRILQLSTYDRGGGAEKVAFDLHRAYRERGHDARLLVRYRFTDVPGVYEADPYLGTSVWAPVCRRFERAVASLPRFRGQYRVRGWLQRIARPRRWIDWRLGREDFNYPYSHRLLDSDGWRPDVVHAHNLHGNYFDLGALPGLSARVPVVWTLHDTWSLTGHCGYFIDCARWKEGCGSCPDLLRAPAIRRDATAHNWRRKRALYAASRLAVATPSHWLAERMRESMLRAWRLRVIPNGVDLSVFRPGDRLRARAELGLPETAFVCVAVTYSGANANAYKDFPTLLQAARQVAVSQTGRDFCFICVGGDARTPFDGTFHYTGYVKEASRLATFYRAADIVLHAAHAETFGLVILEALACGVPVIATAVGGITELIEEGVTGHLVPRGNGDLMSRFILELAERPERVREMGTAAAAAARRYGLDSQVAAYLGWFDELRAEYDGKST